MRKFFLIKVFPFFAPNGKKWLKTEMISSHRITFKVMRVKLFLTLVSYEFLYLRIPFVHPRSCNKETWLCLWSVIY